MEILFENEEMVVINKPAGLVVHSDGRTKEPTVCDWILKEYPEISEVGEPIVCTDGSVIMRPGIVHRLDRETSGAILIAKTEESFLDLKSKFKNREVDKTYHAFVYGNIKEEKGMIDRQIGKSRKNFRQWSAQRGAKGRMREAETRFNVLNRGNDNGDPYCFIEVKPKTGRTHQIRVHMKAINHPVVCDHLYAPKRPCILGFKRLALHARKIKIGDIEIEAPYPDDFISALV